MRKNYNYTRRKLYLPEYGRHIHEMVDSLLEIEDRQERTRQAKAVIAVMGNLNTTLRDTEDFKHKLWDHLFIMSDFKLDIDYPFQVVKPEELVVKPETIEYPQKYIRYRHYGRFLGELIEKAMTIEDEQERKRLINLLANQMKKSFANWNKDGVEDQKIVDDLREYSNGAIDLKVEDLKFNHVRTANNNGQRKQNNQRRQNNNQRRKY